MPEEKKKITRMEILSSMPFVKIVSVSHGNKQWYTEYVSFTVRQTYITNTIPSL